MIDIDIGIDIINVTTRIPLIRDFTVHRKTNVIAGDVPACHCSVHNTARRFSVSLLLLFVADERQLSL